MKPWTVPCLLSQRTKPLLRRPQCSALRWHEPALLFQQRRAIQQQRNAASKVSRGTDSTNNTGRSFQQLKEAIAQDVRSFENPVELLGAQCGKGLLEETAFNDRDALSELAIVDILFQELEVCVIGPAAKDDVVAVVVGNVELEVFCRQSVTTTTSPRACDYAPMTFHCDTL